MAELTPGQEQGRYQFSTLEGLKRRAKRLKRETGMTHTEALELVARAGGYGSYRHALRVLGGIDQ